MTVKDKPIAAFCEEESVTSRNCEVKGRVCEVSLGQRGGGSHGKGGRGMRSAVQQLLKSQDLPGLVSA